MAEKYLTENPAQSIDSIIDSLNADKVLIITDTNVEKAVLPKLKDSEVVSASPKISITPGEDGKNLDTVTKIWDKLEESGATRRSVVLNIGGGVVTDIGGFAAATFKRGIRTVNFPTSLLGAVDAATGGKTGINFKGLKNEIGAFHLPENVIISSLPFATLSRDEILSGYAEMVKTAIISDRDFYISLLELEKVVNDPRLLGESVAKCVEIKEEVVSQDPLEKGLRKILNFGHTAGHAFESIGFDSGHPVTHGKAVAHGMLVGLILSHIILGLDSNEVNHYSSFLKEHYSGALMRCNDMKAAIQKMNSDKKNHKFGEPVFTLLNNIGEPEINCQPTQEEITEALELYIDIIG